MKNFIYKVIQLLLHLLTDDFCPLFPLGGRNEKKIVTVKVLPLDVLFQPPKFGTTFSESVLTCSASFSDIAIILILFSGKSGYIYKQPDPNGKNILHVAQCIWTAFGNHFRSSPDPKPDNFIDYASDQKFSVPFKNDVKIILRILMIFLPLPLFWALYDQQGSTWTFQAREMNRKLFWNLEVFPEQMQIINPLLIMIFIPICEMGIYPVCAKMNFLIKPLERMIVGAIMTAMAFLSSSIVFWHLEMGYKLHVLWLVPQYIFLTLGEILFSITGLEFSYKESPESMRSVIQALWLLTTTLGNFCVVLISKFNSFKSDVSFLKIKM